LLVASIDIRRRRSAQQRATFAEVLVTTRLEVPQLVSARLGVETKLCASGESPYRPWPPRFS
jgi:hypothetical protein